MYLTKGLCAEHKELLKLSSFPILKMAKIFEQMLHKSEAAYKHIERC